MTILTVQFRRDNSRSYEWLLETFARSVEENMPEATFEVLRIEPPEPDGRGQWGFLANTRKLWVWADYVSRCDDELILADCDMLMNANAEEAFDVPFDIAYTKRSDNGRFPNNNGIIMVRPTEAAREFMQMWAEVNQKMYDEPEFHRVWKKKYPGMNQSAFGYMLEEANHQAQLHVYETRKWNAVSTDWAYVDDETVFIHYKGPLRNIVLSGRFPCGAYVDAALRWHEFASEMPMISQKAVNVWNGVGGRRRGGHAARVRQELMRHTGLVEKAIAKKNAEGRGRHV